MILFDFAARGSTKCFAAEIWQITGFEYKMTEYLIYILSNYMM